MAENLRFGEPSASEEAMEQAARDANAHDFIMALPKGYQTVIGERGLRLSGGSASVSPSPERYCAIRLC